MESDYNQISLTSKHAFSFASAARCLGPTKNSYTGVEEGLCGKMQEAKIRKADLCRAAEAFRPAQIITPSTSSLLEAQGFALSFALRKAAGRSKHLPRKGCLNRSKTCGSESIPHLSVIISS